MVFQKMHTMKEYKNVQKLRKQGLGSKNISKITGIPESTIEGWLFKGYLPKHFSKKYRESILKNLAKARQKLEELRKRKLLELYNNITKDFAYVLGALLGDGYIYFYPKGGGHIRISIRDKDFAITFFNSLRRWSGLNCRIYKYDGFWRVYSSSIVVARVMKEFDLNRLKNMSHEIISAFLRGLFDAEGNINNRRIRFYNSELKLINLVKMLLKEIGIKNIYVYKRDKEVHFIGGREFSVKKLYTLEFGRRRNLEIFFNKINFSIKRKQEKLKQALDSYK